MFHKKVMNRCAMLIVLLFAFGLAFLYTPAAEAHSTLLETTPAEKVVTEDSPPTLKLRFNEPVEQDLATVTIYDWNAKPVFNGNPDGGGSVRAPLLEFSLPKLKEGTYTVKWSVVSLDGHPVSGSYVFAVGKATEGGVKSVAGNGGQASLIVSRTIAQGLLLLGAGLFWFGWLAERQGFPGLTSLFGRGRTIAMILLVLATIGELITYALELPPGLVQMVFNGRWDILTEFPFVLMLFTQLFFLVLLCIPGMVNGWYLFMWFALAVIPAFGGHVWGIENPYLAVIPRIIHQLSIALWLGALGYVILLIHWHRKQATDVSWKEFRPFFVYKMMVASGLVVLSGIIMVFLQTGWTAVITDWMGWSTLLLLKVIFTIVMLGLALFQTLTWKKRGSFTTKKVVRVEWIIGLAVILLGVWMSQTAYPVAVKSYDSTLTADQVEAQIHIDKLQRGEQILTASIGNVDGKKPEKINIAISMPDHGMKAGPFPAKKGKSGDYFVTLPFSMSGTWRLNIVASYPDGEEKEWTDDIFIAGNGNS